MPLDDAFTALAVTDPRETLVDDDALLAGILATPLQAPRPRRRHAVREAKLHGPATVAGEEEARLQSRSETDRDASRRP